tara:strand:+ start:2220 stop:2900 length:681 start_codon:yes stop_codon:yes gene_type:complete
MYGFRDSKDAVMDHHGRHTMPGYDPNENMWDPLLDHVKEDAMERMKLDPRRPYRWVPWAVGSGIGLLLGGYPGLAIGGGLGWGYSRYKDRQDPIPQDPSGYQHGGEVKDRFGYGTKELVQARDNAYKTQQVGTYEYLSGLKEQKELASIWRKFTDLEYDSPQFDYFIRGNLEDKVAILQKYANDTDDALWRSKEWMTIVDVAKSNIKGKDKNMLLGGIPTDAIRMN